MTDYENLLLTRDGGVATITLNRENKYNAVNGALSRELIAALKEIAREREIRALVVTGAGKAFCAGQDLSDFDGRGEDFRVDRLVRGGWNRIALALRALEIPVIAAVNGVAAGAGASLALACDIRVLSDRATMLQAFVKIGLVPDTGSTWLLANLVGPERALDLAWSGRTVEAEEAVALGLALEVVPHEDLLARVNERAQLLASMPTRALGMTKRAVYRSLTVDYADALDYEAQLQQAASGTKDYVEGVTAFLEKRAPEFVGA
jgi:2-(1,2-epoxy-1,2-dihydrophenyl)acetyl-CoA isomerase